MTKIKICGIKTIEEAILAHNAGADYLGLLVDIPKTNLSLTQKEAELIAAFNEAGLTMEEQQFYKKCANERSENLKQLKADTSLSDEEKKAKEKEAAAKLKSAEKEKKAAQKIADKAAAKEAAAKKKADEKAAALAARPKDEQVKFIKDMIQQHLGKMVRLMADLNRVKPNRSALNANIKVCEGIKLW